jgi:hypothetical protein
MGESASWIGFLFYVHAPALSYGADREYSTGCQSPPSNHITS